MADAELRVSVRRIYLPGGSSLRQGWGEQCRSKRNHGGEGRADNSGLQDSVHAKLRLDEMGAVTAESYDSESGGETATTKLTLASTIIAQFRRLGGLRLTNFLRKIAAEIWHSGSPMLLMYAKNMPGCRTPGSKRRGIEAQRKAWQPLLRQLAQTMELSYFLQEYRLVRVRTGAHSRARAA
jgi:hypothetical protein